MVRRLQHCFDCSRGIGARADDRYGAPPRRIAAGGRPGSEAAAGQHQGPADRGKRSEDPAMRTTLLALRRRHLLLRRAGLAACPASADRGTSRPDRAQGHPDRQPDPRPPWAAAPEGEPPARPRGDRAHRATCSRRDFFEPRVERRHRDGPAGAPLHAGTKRGSARTSPPSRAARPRARAVRMWMHSPPHRAVLLSPSGRRIGVGKRRGTARERAAGGLHGRSLLARLSRAAGRWPDSIAPR